MKIATILVNKKETACIVTQYGYIPITLINQKYDKNWPNTLFSILTKQKLDEIKNWFYEKRNTILKNRDEIELTPRRISVFLMANLIALFRP